MPSIRQMSASKQIWNSLLQFRSCEVQSRRHRAASTGDSSCRSSQNCCFDDVTGLLGRLQRLEESAHRKQRKFLLRLFPIYCSPLPVSFPFTLWDKNRHLYVNIYIYICLAPPESQLQRTSGKGWPLARRQTLWWKTFCSPLVVD
jgi:hypothetical protein